MLGRALVEIRSKALITSIGASGSPGTGSPKAPINAGRRVLHDLAPLHRQAPCTRAAGVQGPRESILSILDSRQVVFPLYPTQPRCVSADF
jgi:hypothetical protein